MKSKIKENLLRKMYYALLYNVVLPSFEFRQNISFKKNIYEEHF